VAVCSSSASRSRFCDPAADEGDDDEGDDDEGDDDEGDDDEGGASKPPMSVVRKRRCRAWVPAGSDFDFPLLSSPSPGNRGGPGMASSRAA